METQNRRNLGEKVVFGQKLKTFERLTLSGMAATVLTLGFAFGSVWVALGVFFLLSTLMFHTKFIILKYAAIDDVVTPEPTHTPSQSHEPSKT